MRLLLVDDESTTLKRIQSRIDFTSLGIEEVRVAEDGEEALGLCSDWMPDILLSDIVMPRMNGIELAGELRKKWPDLQIIFQSGYMEKQFLKSAIRLQAVNYIEKPIDMDELTDALKKAVEKITRSEKANHLIQRLGDERNDNLRSIIALDFSSDLYDEDKVLGKLKEILTEEEMNQPCFALQLCFYEPSEKTFSNLTSLLGPVNDAASSLDLNCMVAVKLNYLVIFLLAKPGKKTLDKVFFVTEFCRELRKELTVRNLHYTIGTGHVGKDWSELRLSFTEAVTATKLAFFREPGIHSYFRQSLPKYDFDRSEAPEVIRNIKKGRRDSVIFQLRNAASAIGRCEATEPEDIRRFYSSMVMELVRMAKADGLDLYPDFKTEHDLIREVMSKSFLFELTDFLLEGVDKYFDFLERDYYSNSTVNWIIKYIHQNYTDPDLDMLTLSKASNLSTTYISHLFKDVTGGTVRNYITEYRMNEALKLLKNPVNQINDIAQKVGYRNGNYFSFRFKEYYGYSPTEYKDQLE